MWLLCAPCLAPSSKSADMPRVSDDTDIAADFGLDSGLIEIYRIGQEGMDKNIAGSIAAAAIRDMITADAGSPSCADYNGDAKV